jgi:DNA-binding NarL/FixJ family response regulator
VAERPFPISPEAALALVAEANESSSRALTELRDLVRGICRCSPTAGWPTRSAPWRWTHPEVVGKLMTRCSRAEPVGGLSPREREVLALMAEGRSNVAIAQRLFITEKAVSKHAAGIFAKLDLAPSDDDNRRVLAVLAYLGS